MFYFLYHWQVFYWIWQIWVTRQVSYKLSLASACIYIGYCGGVRVVFVLCLVHDVSGLSMLVFTPVIVVGSVLSSFFVLCMMSLDCPCLYLHRLLWWGLCCLRSLSCAWCLWIVHACIYTGYCGGVRVVFVLCLVHDVSGLSMLVFTPVIVVGSVLSSFFVLCMMSLDCPCLYLHRLLWWGLCCLRSLSCAWCLWIVHACIYTGYCGGVRVVFVLCLVHDVSGLSMLVFTSVIVVGSVLSSFFVLCMMSLDCPCLYLHQLLWWGLCCLRSLSCAWCLWIVHACIYTSYCGGVCVVFVLCLVHDVSGLSMLVFTPVIVVGSVLSSFFVLCMMSLDCPCLYLHQLLWWGLCCLRSLSCAWCLWIVHLWCLVGFL